jgi:hypothetical protein
MKHIRKFENFQSTPAVGLPKVSKGEGIDLAVKRLEEIYKTLTDTQKREINKYFEK